MENHLVHRNPVVAGTFYPASSEMLMNELREYFDHAKKVNKNTRLNNVRAIIVPHAGYKFSGQVAATGYSVLPENASFKNIFLIGSSHYANFSGASIYNIGNYMSPLGNVKVNIELADKIITENENFNYFKDAHLKEHCLEVQLPFLQYTLGNDIQIVPIIIGSHLTWDCINIANTLSAYFTPDNLFVISTDFSHYPEYTNAKKVDEDTAQAIISNNPDILLKQLKKNENLNIENLATSLCGWTSVLSLLNMTKDKNVKYIPVHYNNSGDNKPYGDKSQVVGYYSIAVVDEEQFLIIDEESKRELMSIARSSLKHNLGLESKTKYTSTSPLLNSEYGAFVSVYCKDQLRGCIGKFKSEKPLYELIQEMTIAASSMDARFRPIEPDEIDDIKLELSILTPLKKIESLDELELGRHGIYIKTKTSSGTYLPQVAVKTGWSKEQFVSNCSRDKAGIGSDGWKKADLYTYEAVIIKE